MGFLVVSLVAYSSLMYWVTSNAKVTKRNILFNQSQAAAESATESVLATMMRDFNNQSLNPASTYVSATNLPSQSGWPVTFVFSDTNGVTNATSVTAIGSKAWSQLPSRYNGLYGWGQNWMITSIATPQNVGENLSGTISQNIWFGSIPVFQYAIFYNMDLEINPGAAFNIAGRVHSNNNIYATGSSSAAPLTFSNYVEAATKYYSTPSPLDPNNVGRSGNVNFTINVNNPQYPAQTLSLPVGTNNNPASVISILGIPPAGTDPSSPAGQGYIYNNADIVITNSYTNGLTVYYQNFNQTPNLTVVPKDATNISGSTTNLYYSFVTNVTFFDYRESDTVKAVQLDVGKFNKWLTNTMGRGFNTYNTAGATSKGHDINGVYVYNGVQTSGSQLPAVRVMNGQQLPTNGLTVATQFPIYVMGDYNTTTNGVNFSTTLGDTINTRPAGFMGDAITILSASWNGNDSTYVSGYPLNSRIPANITVNAACLEGIVPSNGANYSGGVENFLRLLENWSNYTVTYNGSIVVLFQSQYATSFWGNSSYYNAPARKWGFDTKFNQNNLLPPMTPQVRAIIRGTWATQ